MCLFSKFNATSNDKTRNNVLLIFIHGFGGCAEQWMKQVEFLNPYFDLLTLELPGHGNNISDDMLNEEHFSIAKIISDLFLLLQIYPHPTKIAVGHSYGCSLITLFMEKYAEIFSFAFFLAPCLFPPINESVLKLVNVVPSRFVDLFRFFGVLGGKNSLFIKLYLASNSCTYLSDKMLSWNKSFQTSSLKLTVKTMRWPSFSSNCKKYATPLFVIHGVLDRICNLHQTFNILCDNFDSVKFISLADIGHIVMLESSDFVNACILHAIKNYFDIEVFPYEVKNYSNDFCLQGPLKNREKWINTPDYGGNIYSFIPMKMPFSEYEKMNPNHFQAKFNNSRFILIDVTYGRPSYNPNVLPFQYYKISLESKKVPTIKEIDSFLKIVDALHSDTLIGVHCNYGYNRTGYFICSYLILKMKFKVADALALFAEKRPPGIRHQHFISSLFERFTKHSVLANDINL